jgi:macrolide transport system ATP-binding/permease protein
MWAATTPTSRIFNWPVVEGSFFTEADEASGAAVAVIGQRSGTSCSGPATRSASTS